MVTGTDTVVVNFPEAATLAIGALGEHRLPAGWDADTGCAVGAGGFDRADRECEIARAWAGTFVVEGVGASACGCPAHLKHSADRTELLRSLRAAHGAEPDAP
ncbi:MAG: hypothetical protein ABEJ31_02200 [Haloarculaceae archaeon]